MTGAPSRGLPLLVLLLACQRTQRATPDPAAGSSSSASATPSLAGPVQATQILAAYAHVDLDKPPDNAWAGKAIRISGHLASRFPEEGAAMKMSLGATFRGIHCNPPEEGQPTAHVGDVVLVEGTFNAIKHRPNTPPGVPIGDEPRLLLEVAGCKLISAHPRTFGVTASQRGARVMPLLQFLADVDDTKLRASMLGKAFAVRGIARVDDGYVEVRAATRSGAVRCPVLAEAPLFTNEEVMLAGTLAKVDEVVSTFKDCRPVDP